MSNLHAWDLDPDEAVKVQAALRERHLLIWDGRDVNMIGGVDVSLREDKAHAAIVLLRCPDLKPVEGVATDAPLIFPYIPGLLSFDEPVSFVFAHSALNPAPSIRINC